MRYTREAGSYIRFEQPVQEMQGGERARMQTTMKQLWYCVILILVAFFIIIFAGFPILIMGIQGIALGVGLGSLIVAMLACVFSLGKGPDPKLVQVVELNSNTKDLRDWRYKRGKTIYAQSLVMQDITNFHLDVFDQPAAYVWKLHVIINNQKKPYLLILKSMAKFTSNALEISAMKAFFDEMVSDIVNLVKNSQPSVHAETNHDKTKAVEARTTSLNEVNAGGLLGSGVLMIFGLIGLIVGGAWLAIMWMDVILYPVVASCFVVFMIGFSYYKKESRKKIF